ncbi:RNA polymerase subunit sigma [Leptospira perolatii]|uniref:RNA polymerase subunit sigma n=2 Tax=Leptospira perolatii TaxID=2023191 RepID=A0A2M9ZNU1_9LEPT|nr:RNA polymerase subunit sigma [Leptospira perolatii]PJZ73704.1 RNA polymerase subunit sigma [Leptospira perolatii]
MTGSFSDAEDIVQESYLRWERSKEQEIKSAKAFLSTIAARLSLDSLRKAQRKRETYIGPWLPEPLPPQDESEPDLETLDLAFLHLLEKLNPIERAVFLLRESFGMEYGSIAKAIGKTPDNCRQILKRAKVSLKSESRKFDADLETKRTLVRKFILASSKDQPELLLSYLKEDIVVWSDGGGKVHAARIPILGKERVASFLLRVRKNRSFLKGLEFYFAENNGNQSIIAYSENQPVFMQHYLFDGEGISRIYSLVNPDKLCAYSDKEGLLASGKLIPLELFLLFPKTAFGKAVVPSWTKPVLSLVRWVFR